MPSIAELMKQKLEELKKVPDSREKKIPRSDLKLGEKKITSGESPKELLAGKNVESPPEGEGLAKKIDMNVSSLIKALNYAINTIRNKKDVRSKNISSTYYQYYLEWNKFREQFMKQEGLI